MDQADEGVFPFDAILLELDLNVVSLEVDESHVATAKFHFVADFLLQSSFGPFTWVSGSQPLVGLDKPSGAIRFQADVTVVQGDGASARTFEKDNRFVSPGSLPTFSCRAGSVFLPGCVVVGFDKPSGAIRFQADAAVFQGDDSVEGQILSRDLILDDLGQSGPGQSGFSCSNAGCTLPDTQSTSFQDWYVAP